MHLDDMYDIVEEVRRTPGITKSQLIATHDDPGEAAKAIDALIAVGKIEAVEGNPVPALFRQDRTLIRDEPPSQNLYVLPEDEQ